MSCQLKKRVFASLVVVSPPQRDFGGWPHPTVLAACALLDVDEIYAVGGAQAVAMLAYGVELADGSRCDSVDLVTGPGNIYVTAAKRALQGIIGIDSEAGPTEVAILADDTADPRYVAADLISQAEHDVIAAAVLVTTSENLANAVLDEVRAQVANTKHTERITEALTGIQSAVIIVRDIEQGLEVVDAYAAEHLEIHTREASGCRYAGSKRWRDFRRAVGTGLARRLLRWFQSRAADDGCRAALIRSVGSDPSCAVST